MFRGRGWHAVVGALGLALLLFASARQGFAALDPISLWLDDLWVATLVKRASLAELWRLHAPAPYGFVVLEKLMRAVCGDGHLQLQAAPFLARLLAIAGLGVVAAELTRNLGLGLLAATALSLQSELAQQAVRVKHYALDALVSVLLLGCAVTVLRRPSLPRIVGFGVASLLALPVSFPSAFVGPALFSLCALAYAYDRRQLAPATALRVLSSMLLFDALSSSLLLLLVSQKATPALQEFWAAYYPPHDNRRALWEFFRDGPGHTFLTGAFEPWPVLAWLVPVGVYQLVRRRWTRPLGLFVIVLHAAVLLSASLHMYPLGVPRLDSYVSPLQLLAAAVALQPLANLRWLRPLGPAPALAVLLAAVSQLETRPVAYVPAGEKPLAVWVQRWLRDPNAGLVLFPWANWAFAYYTDGPVHLVPVTDSTNGFFAIPERPRSWVLRETWNGVFFSEYARDSAAFAEQLASLYASPPPKLVFYGSYGDAADYRAMLRQLKRQHYVVVSAHSRERAIAALLERR